MSSKQPWRTPKKRRSREDAQLFVDALTQGMPADAEWYLGGSWRRGAPTVGDFDIGIITESLDDFVFPPEVTVQHRGPRKIMGDLTVNGQTMHIDFWAVLPEELGAWLLYITGPVNYNIAMRYDAGKLGWLLNEKGLFDKTTGARLDDGTEESIFAKLYPYQPHKHLTPEQRQDFAEPIPDSDTVTRWMIPSRTSDETWEVTRKGTGANARWSCKCKDFIYRGRRNGKGCWHIQQVQEHPEKWMPEEGE